MPQMMPLNWMAMFMMINMLLLMFTVIMFNMFIPTMNKKSMPSTTMMKKKWSW